MKLFVIKIALITLLLPALGCTLSCFSQSNSAAPVAVPGTAVYLKRPSGFTEASGFSGFKNEASGASILVTEIPGPYSQITAGFNSQGLKTRGMNLITRQAARFGDRNGILLQVSQNAYGQEFLKWIGAFGTESKTVLITASFPKSSSTKLSNPLKSSVLSATWNPKTRVDPESHLTYSVSAVAPFKLATRIQNSLLFTIGGTFPQKSPDKPVFVAAQGLAPVRKDDWELFAHQVIRKSSRLTDMKESSFAPVTIDGLNGYESSAIANDTRNGIRMFIYQVILYTTTGYYRMQGQVSEKEHDRYAEPFKQLAGTFTRIK